MHQEENLLIFLHIVKAGGTSLRWALEEQFPCKNVLRCYESKGCTLDQVSAIPEKKRKKFQFFVSHYSFGTHELFPQPASYITMLRKPIARSISQYYSFIYEDPKGKWNNSVRSIAGYIHNMKRIKHDNLQLRYIANLLQEEELTTSHLEIAKANLENHFSAVGITERFEESLALFSKVFGWKKLTYVRRNITKSKPVDFRLEPDLLKLLNKHNELDLALYEFCLSLFDSELEKHKVCFTNINSAQQNTMMTKGQLYFRRAFRKVQRKILRLP